MFPISMTFNVANAEQLATLVLAVNGNVAASPTSTAKADTAKKSEAKSTPAATEPAATTTTAAATAAPEQKASTSAPADRAASILDKDALTNAVKTAIAKVGRDKVVELINSYGAAKAGDVDVDKRAEFDKKLLALAA